MEMSTARRVVPWLLALVSVLLLASCDTQKRTDPSTRQPPTTSQLLTRLGTLDLEPHPVFAGFVEPGAVFLPSDLDNSFRCSTVFKEPDSLMAESGQPVSGTYTDEVRLDGTLALPFLRFLGIEANASIASVYRVVSKVTDLRSLSIRRTRLLDATLQDGIINDLDEWRTLVVVESVGQAKVLALEFLDQTGGNAGIDLPETVTARASGSDKAESIEEFREFVFASRPALRIGGPGSGLSPQDVSDLRTALEAAGARNIESRVDVVIATLTWDQVHPVCEMLKSKRQAKVAAAQVLALEEERALNRREFERQLAEADASRKSAQQALASVATEVAAKEEEYVRARKAALDKLASLGTAVQQLRREVNTKALSPADRDAVKSSIDRLEERINACREDFGRGPGIN